MTKLLLSEWNVLLMAAVWICMSIAEHAFPMHFEKGRLVNRMEPMFPVMVCVAFSTLIPGPWIPPETTLGQKLILGVILGAGSYNFTAMAKRFNLTPFVAKLGTKRRRSTESVEKVIEDVHNDG